MMRIYKGSVGVDLTTQAFLDFLEEDALDEIINMILDLEKQESSLYDDMDGDIVFMGVVDLDDLEDGDISNLFDHIANNVDHYDDWEEDVPLGGEGLFMTEDEIIDNLLLSNEDLRLKRIVERFRHIDDAS